MMGGQCVSVREEGREVELPTWSAFAERDPLNARTALELSTRGYRRSVDEVPAELDADSTSKSAVIRRLVAMTQQQLETWLRRDLSQARRSGSPR